MTTDWFEEAKDYYNGTDRVYHTWVHVLSCLSDLSRISKSLDRKRYLRLRCALAYHDAIYDTHAKDNEERSADVAFRNLSAHGVAEEDLNEITRLILLTKHHNPEFNDEPGKIMCDIDCAILGAVPATYRAYVAGVRREYGWVDDDAWRKGRTGVLHGFLSRPVIFRSPYFKDLEHPARRNMRDELSDLARSALCKVCADTGLTYDMNERRLVPCGGIACRVLP